MTDAIEWRPYDGAPDSTVVGDVRVSDPISVEYLDVERKLLAYLPPGYEESDRSYPVVYMHDGRNLFDEAASNDGEWGVDETMEELADDGIEAIVVGVPNAGEDRMAEYAPFLDTATLPPDMAEQFPEGEVYGDQYLDFLLETVKPAVESAFRTSDDRDETGVAGSSMGGLISLYAQFREPETFGFAGVMSPAVTPPFTEIFEFVESVGHVDARIHVDVGGEEFAEEPAQSEAFEDGARRLADTLEQMGYDENLQFVYEGDAVHHESAWRRRFPEMMRFLL